MYIVGIRLRNILSQRLVLEAEASQHRRMRRGGRGAAAPPQLLGNSVFWAAAVLFLGSSNGGRRVFFNFPEGGCFTSRGQCPRGGVLVNVQEWGCFSIFRRANDVTQTMSKGGGVLVKSPPFRKSCYLCKILGSQPLRPPNQSGPIRLWASVIVIATLRINDHLKCIASYIVERIGVLSHVHISSWFTETV